MECYGWCRVFCDIFSDLFLIRHRLKPASRNTWRNMSWLNLLWPKSWCGIWYEEAHPFSAYFNFFYNFINKLISQCMAAGFCYFGLGDLLCVQTSSMHPLVKLDSLASKFLSTATFTLHLGYVFGSSVINFCWQVENEKVNTKWPDEACTSQAQAKACWQVDCRKPSK